MQVSKIKSPIKSKKHLEQSDETLKSPRLKLTGSSYPKKRKLAYFYFGDEKREAVMKEDPTIGLTGCSKLLGQAWSLLDET